jgi:hexosaminidase
MKLQVHYTPRAIVLIALLFFVRDLSGQSIIPAPVQMTKQNGSFALQSSTLITSDKKNEELNKIISYFNSRIKQASGYELKNGEATANVISLKLLAKADTRLGKEGYSLQVTPTQITAEANTSAGIFYAIQSILQLLPAEIESSNRASVTKWEIAACNIVDYPRFGWRGVMLDVSRHFFTKDYVKEYIDQLARYKFNRLHLHLTDDNGWRLEIKSYPKLTSVGAWRVPRTGTFGSHEAPKAGEPATDGGFYTQEDMKEIIQHAKSRYIEILPEVDVPGHSMAVLAAYPELCVTNDTSLRVNPGSSFSTWHGNGAFTMHLDNTLNPTDEKVYTFLDKVVGEIATLFPFEYIHMGGDECYKGFWERDPKVQAFMKKNNVKDGIALQAYFTKRVDAIVTSKKKKMIGWDEILEGGIAPGAAVMSWQGVKGGIEASHLKHPVVMSPAPDYYLDMRQGDPAIEPPVYSNARLKQVYDFNLLPKEIDSTYVLGGQGNLWTEQIPTEAQVEYMTFPRAWAMSETLWSPSSKKNWNDFVTRVEKHFVRFDHARVNYATSIYDPIISVKKNNEGRIVVELSTEASGLDLFYSLDNTIPNSYSDKYSRAIVFPPDVDQFRVIAYRDNKPIGHLISVKTEDLVKRIKK